MKILVVFVIAAFSGKHWWNFLSKTKLFSLITGHFNQLISSNVFIYIYFLLIMVNPLGCHANMMWQDKPEHSMDLVKNAFWNYVSQATLTAEDTLQMIRNSELGQEIK